MIIIIMAILCIDNLPVISLHGY